MELLAGPQAVPALARARVILFGVGGVGSWCAEGLVRSGVGHLTIVDSDLVCVTNVNRQVQALHSTVGRVKVTALARRLRDINPDAEIVALQTVYDKSTAPHYSLEKFDYVVDAIDSLSPKVELAIQACASSARFYSSLGASSRLDPTKIRVASVWKTEKCRLGRFVRKRLRKRGFSGDYLCVYSAEEQMVPWEGQTGCGTGVCLCPGRSVDDDGEEHEWCSSKAQINGSVVHITATFGFFLSGLVVNDILQRQIQLPQY